jgi:hypothetical protein
MPSLGEYLGQVVAEVTAARVHADLAAVRIAEFYAAHPVLRHLPVPHFRLPSVTIDVPVVVTGVAPGAVPARSGLDDVEKTVDALVEKEFARAGIALPRQARAVLSRRLGEQVVSLLTAEFPLGASHIAERLVATCAEALVRTDRPATAPSADALSQLRTSLQGSLTAEIARRQPGPPRVSVAVTSAEIKTLGSPDAVLRLHLTITEEALEWTQGTDDGAAGRLVPE